MGALARGSVVLVPFPFSDLSQSKLRPAVVLASASHGDFILCQVTSKTYGDPASIALTKAEFSEGELQRDSYVRPGKLFTASSRLIRRSVGTLTNEVSERIVESIVRILRDSGIN